MERAEKEGMLPIIELYNDYLLAIINMTCAGINIDIVQCEKTLKDFNGLHLEYLEKAQEILKDYWTDPRLPMFNINSPDHKSAVLFGGVIKVDEKVQDGYYKNGNERYRKTSVGLIVEGFRVPPSVSTSGKKEGLYSTDDGVIKKIAAQTKNPKLKAYCEYQKQAMMYKKAAKTYCQAFLDRSVSGILYPNFNNTITPTGRLSASDPNTQNLPSKAETAEAIEGLLVAPPGFTCVSADYSQLEKWVQAWQSGDQGLIDKLLAGYCLHCVALSQKEGMDYEEVYRLAVVEEVPEWVAKRKAIKPVSFQMDYGAMPPKVVLTTGLPLETVEEFYELDKKLYPQKNWFFRTYLPEELSSNTSYSLEINIPASRKKGKDGSRFENGVELLPIFDKNGNVSYTKGVYRNIGTWSTKYGKRYSFFEHGRQTKQGLRRSFSFTEPMNYPNQGGGSDIQAATSAALLRTCLEKPDRFRMILEIHDSKRFYIRTDVLDQGIRHIKAVMEDVPKIFKERFNVDVPFKFPVSFEIGPDFGHMKSYEIK